MKRVLVVDDSAFVRRALARVLAGVPGIGAVTAVASGDEAVARLDDVAPDLVTLDIDMPGLDGHRTLRALLARRPGLPVIMLSVLARRGAEATLDALAAGAVDFIDKSSFNVMDLERLRAEVIEKLRPWLRASAPPPPVPRATAAASLPPAPPRLDPARYDVAVVGASTGGPSALAALLRILPADLTVPLVIAQHMPAGFTSAFAARLDALSPLAVREAADGDALAPGLALVAPAGRQTRVRADLRVAVSSTDQAERHAPCVDVLMRSAAAARPGRVLGVLLTGMGDDGAAGMAAIRAGGGTTLAESEATCVVYGMPRAAHARGAVSALLPLPELARVLAGLGKHATPPGGPR